MKNFEVNTRMRIRIDTETEVMSMVNKASQFPTDVHIEIVDAEGMRVNARSVLGMLYAMTFTELWLESDQDVYAQFKEFCIS